MIAIRTKRNIARFRNFLRRPFSDHLLALQAFVLLGMTRFLINCFSFSKLEQYLGRRMQESNTEDSDESLFHAKRISWAVRSVAPFTPWNSNCFPQALTAKVLLRKKGINSTLYVGAAFKTEEEGLRGHAWLRCGSYFVTGGDGASQFGAIASFSD